MAAPADMVELRRAVDEMSDLQRRAAEITARRADDWRHALVATRRRLAAATGHLYEQLESFRLHTTDTEVLLRFLRAFRDVRRTLALHQATWPAVSADPDAANFRASATELRSAYDHLRSCMAELERSTHRPSQGTTP